MKKLFCLFLFFCVAAQAVEKVLVFDGNIGTYVERTINDHTKNGWRVKSVTMIGEAVRLNAITAERGFYLLVVLERGVAPRHDYEPKPPTGLEVEKR